jgi:hypothetical protein
LPVEGFETEDGIFTPIGSKHRIIVEMLKTFGTVTNAALLFMHPTDGLRV